MEKYDKKEEEEVIEEQKQIIVTSDIYIPKVYLSKDKDIWYEEQGSLGSGSYGSVHLGEYKGIPAAFKVVSKDCEYIEKEKNNALIIKNLPYHKNIMEIFDVTENNDGDVIIIMELAQKITITDILPKKQYQVLDIIKQICKGLSFLNKNGIVHRDIKPDNLMQVTDKKGKTIYKITDFGTISQTENMLMQTKIGTPEFLAPDIITQQEYDETVDVWSLGLTADLYYYGGDSYFMDVNGNIQKTLINIRSFSYFRDAGEFNNVLQNILNQMVQKTQPPGQQILVKGKFKNRKNADQILSIVKKILAKDELIIKKIQTREKYNQKFKEQKIEKYEEKREFLIKEYSGKCHLSGKTVKVGKMVRFIRWCTSQ